MDELRDRIATYLSSHRVCVISTTATHGTWAIPAWYRSCALQVECVFPRWSDVTYYLTQNPRVLLLILDLELPGLRWLEYRGAAELVTAPDWENLLPDSQLGIQPQARYVAARVKPERIDLIDESRGWGLRETLDW